MLILRNRVLRRGNVHIWVVAPYYVDDLLIFRNCVLNLKYVKVKAVPYCKGIHLRIVRNDIFRLRNVLIRRNKLMPRNRVFRLRNVQICLVLPARCSIC